MVGNYKYRSYSVECLLSQVACKIYLYIAAWYMEWTEFISTWWLKKPCNCKNIALSLKNIIQYQQIALEILYSVSFQNNHQTFPGPV